MIRQMQTGGNKALSFGKSRARLLSMQQKKVTFKDVAGVDEAKEELREIIEFLVHARYCWFALGADSKLQRVSTELAAYDANLVALPEERIEEFRRMVEERRVPERLDATRRAILERLHVPLNSRGDFIFGNFQVIAGLQIHPKGSGISEIPSESQKSHRLGSHRAGCRFESVVWFPRPGL